MARGGGPDVLGPVIQVGDGRVQLVESVDVLIALQGVGHADGIAAAEALVGAHQQCLVGAVAAADGCLYGSVGAGDAGHGSDRRSTGRNDWTVNRVVVIEIDAAQFFVDVMAE